MARSEFLPRQPLSIAAQRVRMETVWSEFACRISRGEGVWVGAVAPTLLSETYTIRVIYKVGKAPVVNVLEPELELHPGAPRPPHVYRGNVLCLYLPRAGEWGSEMALAETIVPWSVEWLYFYEVWVVTGTWEGGGHEPSLRGGRGRAPRR